MKYIFNIISRKKFVQIGIFKEHSKMSIYYFCWWVPTHINHIKSIICYSHYRVDIRDKPGIC